MCSHVTCGLHISHRNCWVCARDVFTVKRAHNDLIHTLRAHRPKVLAVKRQDPPRRWDCVHRINDRPGIRKQLCIVNVVSNRKLLRNRAFICRVLASHFNDNRQFIAKARRDGETQSVILREIIGCSITGIKHNLLRLKVGPRARICLNDVLWLSDLCLD